MSATGTGTGTEGVSAEGVNVEVVNADPHRPVGDRIAGAPISWGVCEVPDWGYQLPVGTVLEQMSEIGVKATELGPDGFLPADPQEMADTLAGYGLRAVGQFVPVVLHDAEIDPLPSVQRAIDGILACGADTLVLAAATGRTGYDVRPVLDEDGWKLLLGNLDLLAEAARARGVRPTLHPHVGTMIETDSETRRVLEGSTVGLCLDTGHLLIGGADPSRIVADYTARVEHVHLKDVEAALAVRVQSGELTYTEAIAEGMYRPLGTGDVDIAGIVASLESAGYDGWYVMEQDTIVDAAGTNPAGRAALDDVRSGVSFLRKVADELTAVGR